jgi:RNA polymerase sigma factor (TIGR02999 family)
VADDTLEGLLEALERGEAGAFERAYARVYAELRAVAHRQRRSLGAGETLSTTALVHEAFLKLSGGRGLAVHDHHHLVALAARAMRQILVDAARARLTAKRGGGRVAEQLEDELDAAALASSELAVELLALDRALARLARLDERLARLVEWRYFGGLTDRELAGALSCSERTVRRDWTRARAFLQREMGASAAP